MRCIYIGPSVKKYNLYKNRIYKEYPTEKVEELKNAGYPLAKLLFCNIEYLSVANAEKAKKGSAINKAYESMVI